MAKVRKISTSVQKVWSKSVSGRLLVDLSSGKNKLGKDYDQHISIITSRLADKVAVSVSAAVKEQYNSGISEIQKELRGGISGTPSKGSLAPPASTSVLKTSKWSPLTKRYYDRKPKASRNKFWVNRKNKGLSGLFGSFAGSHKSAVTRKNSVVNLKPRGKQAKIKRFRYAVTYTLPSPSVGGGYFKELLQHSFFEGKAYSGKGYGLDPHGLAVLGYLEGEPSAASRRHRPFIAALMASRGRVFTSEVVKGIKSLKT